MNRSLITVLGALALGAAVFAACYAGSKRVTAMACAADDLSWLRSEFHLNAAEMARIQKLHEGYLPECAKMCAMIAAKKTEVQAALANGTNVTAEAQTKLTELADLRAQCQAEMLRHFITVSQAMPPEEGRRYLDKMEQITIGAHAQVERSMSTMPAMTGHERGTN